MNITELQDEITRLTEILSVAEASEKRGIQLQLDEAKADLKSLMEDDEDETEIDLFLSDEEEDEEDEDDFEDDDEDYIPLSFRGDDFDEENLWD